VLFRSIKDFFDRISHYACYDLGFELNKKTWEFDISMDDVFKIWLEKKSHYFGKDPKSDTKIIVICGTEDNSIPYWLQEYIEDRLNAIRYHLG
jgi:hypothetical protein